MLWLSPKLPRSTNAVDISPWVTPEEAELHQLFLEAENRGEAKVILTWGVQVSFSALGVKEEEIPANLKWHLERAYWIVKDRYRGKFLEWINLCLLLPKEKQEDAFKKLMTIFVSPNSIALMKDFYEFSGKDKKVEEFLISMAKMNDKTIDKDIWPFASALQWWTAKNLSAWA